MMKSNALPSTFFFPSALDGHVLIWIQGLLDNVQMRTDSPELHWDVNQSWKQEYHSVNITYNQLGKKLKQIICLTCRKPKTSSQKKNQCLFVQVFCFTSDLLKVKLSLANKSGVKEDLFISLYWTQTKTALRQAMRGAVHAQCWNSQSLKYCLKQKQQELCSCAVFLCFSLFWKTSSHIFTVFIKQWVAVFDNIVELGCYKLNVIVKELSFNTCWFWWKKIDLEVDDCKLI